MMREIKEFLTLEDYEVVEEKGDTFVVRSGDNVEKVCCMTDNVFFGSVACVSLSKIEPSKVAEVKDLLLSADNGISTSSFSLVPASSGDPTITLNSMCTIQDLGEEDKGDIRSLLQYLSDDSRAAHDLLSGYLKREAVNAG